MRNQLFVLDHPVANSYYGIS